MQAKFIYRQNSFEIRIANVKCGEDPRKSKKSGGKK